MYFYDRNIIGLLCCHSRRPFNEKVQGTEQKLFYLEKLRKKIFEEKTK
ncbi:MAG: hypothetical protein AVDCRST_MAG96-1461 [uncultured Segetibacter sp.]|uniref:Uncharacterized protein n=1 Tax=uncultured Segetibacter sp. TaxID=481133 RepID=A0A6J4SES7_9BACT|nr:MAG: hypothetical protein AVDCRST_MAG96-1461 [uncultured Segetibacter sp.]